MTQDDAWYAKVLHPKKFRLERDFSWAERETESS